MIKLRFIRFATLSFVMPLLLSGCNLAILNPKGVIAADEKQLLITSVLLMLIIVVPVIILTLVIAWKYRAANTASTYSPDWSHSTILEVIWWSIPCVIIGILAVITWTSSHQLDPYKPLAGNAKTLTIEAIALDWKWLFIYPDQKIATVNFVQIPVNVPVKFLITADAPMNSFEIPQLAGQIYAMAGMQTKMNLMADQTGDYQGLSTNYSGQGFSNMDFIIRASSQQQFDHWVNNVQQSPDKLTADAYTKLTLPSENNVAEYFSYPKDNLFAAVVMKYMMPMNNTQGMDMVYASN